MTTIVVVSHSSTTKKMCLQKLKMTQTRTRAHANKCHRIFYFWIGIRDGRDHFVINHIPYVLLQNERNEKRNLVYKSIEFENFRHFFVFIVVVVVGCVSTQPCHIRIQYDISTIALQTKYRMTWFVSHLLPFRSHLSPLFVIRSFHSLCHLHSFWYKIDFIRCEKIPKLVWNSLVENFRFLNDFIGCIECREKKLRMQSTTHIVVVNRQFLRFNNCC